MSTNLLSMAIQGFLALFFSFSLVGMVYMCWKRSRIERSGEASHPVTIATEQEQRRTQAVRLLGAPRELPVVQVKAWRPRVDRVWDDRDVQEVFIEWARQDQPREGA